MKEISNGDVITSDGLKIRKRTGATMSNMNKRETDDRSYYE